MRKLCDLPVTYEWGFPRITVLSYGGKCRVFIFVRSILGSMYSRNYHLKSYLQALNPKLPSPSGFRGFGFLTIRHTDTNTCSSIFSKKSTLATPKTSARVRNCSRALLCKGVWDSNKPKGLVGKPKAPFGTL